MRWSSRSGCRSLAAAINLVFGMAVVWALVRYEFPGRRLLDAIVDIPFALPTAVAGIALTNLYSENGWLGRLLAPLGIQVAFTPLGIFVALVFVGLPFVVRTVQPVLEDLDAEMEEAAATLGASRFTTIRRVIFPTILPALLTGFALAFARAVGEYGSVIFIAGNLPNVSEIAPLLIVIRLEEFRYADATAIAAVMLVASFLLLLAINLLQRWSERRTGRKFSDRPAAAALPRYSPRLAAFRTASMSIRKATRASDARADPAADAPGDHRHRDRVPAPVHRRSRWSMSSRRPSRRDLRPISRRSAIRMRSPRSSSRSSAAAISVGLNLVFGVLAAWAITKYRIPRQEPADHG